MNKENSRIYAWSVNHVPAPFVARPFECFMVVILVNSSLAILFNKSNPPSLENVLKHEVWNVCYYVWGVALLIGALAMAWSLASIRWVHRPTVYVMPRVAQYRLGMRLLALCGIVFGAAVMINGGWNGLAAASISFIFAGMCLARMISLRSSV